MLSKVGPPHGAGKYNDLTALGLLRESRKMISAYKKKHGRRLERPQALSTGSARLRPTPARTLPGSKTRASALNPIKAAQYRNCEVKQRIAKFEKMSPGPGHPPHRSAAVKSCTPDHGNANACCPGQCRSASSELLTARASNLHRL